MDAHLIWLNGTLRAHLDALRRLRQTFEVSSYCGVSIDGVRASFGVSAEALRMFVDVGISMAVSLIFAGYSEMEARLLRGPGEELDQRMRGTDVSLRVGGSSLDFGTISASLGTEPSEAYRAGSLDPSGRPHVGDLWSLTAPLLGTEELDARLRWLGNVLVPASPFLRSLSNQADIVVRCDFFTEEDISDVEISPEALRPLVDTKIPMDFHAHLI
jgi:hypothetical protein